ncbi:MAG: hypothetical protein CSA66_07460 [Proteobacteria bacterium]|nr:MAG: hypothetical protein CSA66_07460 [Pseudomonadota bacterium]
MYEKVLEARWLVAAALVAITVWLGGGLWPPGQLLVDFSFEGLLVAGGEERDTLDRYLADFGEDVGVVAVLLELPPPPEGPPWPAGTVFSPRALRLGDEIAAWLRARPEIDARTTLSLVDLSNLRAAAITPGYLRHELRILDGSGGDAQARARFAAATRAMQEHRLYQGRVFSVDGRAALISASFNAATASPALRAPLIADLRGAIERWRPALPPGAALHLTGVPVIQQAYSDIALSDLTTFIPITAAVVMLLLWWGFRSPAAVVAPMPGVALATVWGMGLMQLQGEPINLVNNVTGVVVLVIGVADGVHVLARYQQLLPTARSKRTAIVEAMVAMTPACLVTTLTTAAGFASLVTATIPTIQAFGGYVAVAILFAFVAQMLALPIALSLLPAPARPHLANTRRSRTGRALEATARMVARRWRAVLVAAGAALAALTPGLLQLDDDARALGELHADHPVAAGLHAMERRLSGALVHAIYIEGLPSTPAAACRNDDACAPHESCRRSDPAHRVVASLRDPVLALTGATDLSLWDALTQTLRADDAPADDRDDDELELVLLDDEPDGDHVTAPPPAPRPDGVCVASVKAPYLVRALAGLSAWLKGAPGHRAIVSRVDGLAELVAAMHGALVPGAPDDALPADLDRVGVHQLLSLLSGAGGDLLARWVTPDFTRTRLTITANDVGTHAWQRLEADLGAQLTRRLDEDHDLGGRYAWAITGGSTLAERALTHIVRDMGASLAWAALVILLMMAALLKSLRVALIGMIPNAWPLVVTLALMGYAGVTVRVSTVIIFSVALGIAVDDTVHFLHRFRVELRAGATEPEAVARASVQAGRAMLLTTAILVAGFSVFLASDFVAMQQFGLFAALTMALALVGDLVVLPALLRGLGVASMLTEDPRIN